MLPLPRILRSLVAASILLAAARALAEPGLPVEVWLRKPAAKGDPTATRKDVKSIDLDALPLAEARRADLQYGGWFTYRGVKLQTLIDRAGAPPDVDLALLHFGNGMQVPYAFRDAELARRLDLFVARQMQPAPGAPFATGRFPPISRAREGFVDVRPITFGGNKLVVAERAHPAVPADVQATFSPWLYVDSLTGIELVSSKAYYAQLDVSANPAERAGFQLYTQSCQFCHAARHVGASFGWDFVEPVALYTYRGKANLFYHVKYKPLDASAKGLLMPALSHMTEQDATSIWRWLRAVATTPMPAYAP
jgi:mono/diheme cytochrome c family protein